MHARDTLVWHCADMLLPAVQCSAAVVQLTRNCDAEAIMPSDGMGSKEWFNDQLCDLALQFELSWPAAGDVWYHLATYSALCCCGSSVAHAIVTHAPSLCWVQTDCSPSISGSMEFIDT